MYSFDEHSKLTRLQQATYWSRVTFALACSTRMTECVHKYLLRAGPDRWTAYSLVLSTLWDMTLRGDEQTRATLSELLNKTMSLLPETEAEDGDDLLRTMTDDATASLAYAIRCMLTGEAQEAVWSARRAYEALDEYVIQSLAINPGNLTMESRVLSHSAIQAELKRQNIDLDELVGELSSPELVRDRSYYDAKTYCSL